MGAFYWVTPIPAAWPKERVESKLREYNFYKLKLLTIHEAMPGHYVQMEFANDVQPKARRLLRSVFGNGPYIEGWGQYATQMMLDEGFLDHSPELALTFAKEELRVLANAILDVRLQMLEHDRPGSAGPDEEADLPGEGGSHRQAAARQTLLRPAADVFRGLARLDQGPRRIQAGQRQRLSLRDFNDRALKEGAVPLPALEPLLK